MVPNLPIHEPGKALRLSSPFSFCVGHDNEPQSIIPKGANPQRESQEHLRKLSVGVSRAKPAGNEGRLFKLIAKVRLIRGWQTSSHFLIPPRQALLVPKTGPPSLGLSASFPTCGVHSETKPNLSRQTGICWDTMTAQHWWPRGTHRPVRGSELAVFHK